MYPHRVYLRRALCFSLLISLWLTAGAQSPLTPHAGTATVSVSGTSTLHDWTMTTPSGSVSVSLALGPQQLPTAVQGVTVTVAVSSLKSGKSAMDKNAYGALKAEANPSIRFEQQGEATGPAADGTWSVPGALTVAGQRRAVVLSARVSRDPSGALIWTGRLPMQMTDYGVKPPVLMMGTLKTGNAVTVDFTARLSTATTTR